MSTAAPVLEQGLQVTPRSKIAILVGSLILAILAFQLNASLLSPALPSMASDLRVSISAISQAQSLFFLSGSVLGMIMARWSDAIGRRRAFLICMAALVIGSVLTLVAPSLPVLLVGRVLQGTSSATFTIAYLILAGELSARQFGIAVGVVTAVNGGLGGFDGYIGGAVTQHFGWRALFAIVLCVAIIGSVCAFFAVPKRPPVADVRMDWWGATVLSVFLICFTQFLGVVSDSAHAFQTLAYLVGAVASAGVFVLIERKAHQPLIAVTALRTRTVWPVLSTTFLTVAGMFASTNFTIVTLSQDLKSGYGLNSTMSGLLYLVPTAITGVLVAVVSGRIAQRIGWVIAIRVSTGALVLLSAAIAIFADNRWLVFGLLIACGVFYLGQYQSSANGLSVLNSPQDAPGSLPGIHGACFGLGAGAGIALVAPLIGQGTLAGYQAGLWVSTGLALLAFFSALLTRPTATALPARLSGSASA